MEGTLTMADVGLPEKASSTGEEPKPGTGETEPAGSQPAKPEDSENLKAEPSGKEDRVSGIQRRFDELTAEKWALARELEETRARLEQLDQEFRERLEQVGKTRPEGRPTRDSFETEDEYLEALADWKVQQRIEALRREEEQQIAQETARERQAGLRAKLLEGAARYPDFDQVAFRTPFPYTPAMLEAITHVDDPAAVAYYLGKHPTIGAELASMNPTQAAVKMGQVAAIVRAGKPPEPKGLTQAPEPAKPLAGGGAPSPDLQALANMSQDEFNKFMSQKRKGKYRI